MSGATSCARIFSQRAKALPGGLLFTPGPLTTTSAVRQAMAVDWGSRDERFLAVVRDIRRKLLQVGNVHDAALDYTAIPMQGSGSMGVEAVLGTVVPPKGRVLIIQNGAYGARMAHICDRLRIDAVTLSFPECSPPSLPEVEAAMQQSPDLTTVAIVHCETTTGLLNPLADISALRRRHIPGATFFVDAMSSFGGVPMDLGALGVDYLCTSSNKCIQGTPGVSVVLARVPHLLQTRGWARGYCLDLLQQYEGLERTGQFNNTPPIQTLMALNVALDELYAEGGPSARCRRYQANARVIREGLQRLGFRLYLKDPAVIGWTILTFEAPDDPKWDFDRFYALLSAEGFVIYPGKLTHAPCFRVGCVGDLHPADCQSLVDCVGHVVGVMGLTLH